MALTESQFRAALRIGDAPEEIEQATRIRGYVYIAIEKHAPDAPDAVKDEAAARLGGYLYDQPNIGRSGTFANSLRSSGAAFILLPYVQHRLGLTDTELTEEAAGSGTAVNPVTSILVVAGQLIVIYQDGTIVDLDLPSGGDGGDTPSTIDESEVRRIINETLTPGNSRGAEIARTSTLPTTPTSDDINITFTLGSVSDFAPVGNTLRVPLDRPSSETIGIWAVAQVDGVETDEVFIPWGGGSFEDESNTRNEYSYHGLSFGSTTTADRYIDIQFAPKRGSFGTLSLQGDSDTLPADSVVAFYLAQSGGVTNTGAPSSAVDADARQAAANAQAAADAADQRAAGNTTLIGNLNTNLQSVRATHLQQHDIQSGSGIAVDLIDDVDNGPGVRIRNTQTPGSGGVTTEELETLLPTASQTQAEAPSGTSRLIWTVTRLRQLITAALPTVSNSDAISGTSAARRVWTALRVRQAINAVVPAVFRTGNTDRIAENKLPQDALLQEQVQSTGGTIVIDQLPNGAGVDLAVAAAAEGRLGVLEFIRPGSDTTKVIGRLRRVQDFPASTNDQLEATPFYVGEDGGYTLSVNSAFDFGGGAFTGEVGTTVIIVEGETPIAPIATNEDMLLLRRGQLYRQDVHPGRNLAVGWRAYAPSDAPAGQTYIGAIDSLNDVPRTASHTANQLYFIRQGGVWALTNGSGGFTEAPPDHWLGNKAYSHDADTAVNTHSDETTPEGIGFVAAYATQQAPQLFPYVSTSYTAPAEESRVWVRIDDDLQARIAALENAPSPGPIIAQIHADTGETDITGDRDTFQGLYTITADVIADVPTTFYAVGDVKTVTAQRFVNVDLSLEQNSNSSPVADTDDAEFISVLGKIASDSQDYVRETVGITVWPHVTGSLTIYLRAFMNDPDATGAIRNWKVLRVV